MPYIVLTILLIRGLTLDGALDGIKYFIVPRFNELGNFGVSILMPTSILLFSLTVLKYKLNITFRSSGSSENIQWEKHEKYCKLSGNEASSATLINLIILKKDVLNPFREQLFHSYFLSSWPFLAFIAVGSLLLSLISHIDL